MQIRAFVCGRETNYRVFGIHVLEQLFPVLLLLMMDLASLSEAVTQLSDCMHRPDRPTRRFHCQQNFLVTERV